MATKLMQKIMAFDACERCKIKRQCALKGACQSPVVTKRKPGRPKKVVEPVIVIKDEELT